MRESLPLGGKVARVRTICGMKQETLAAQLGISQQAVSKLEQSEQIEPEVLEKIAIALGVPIEAIKNYSDEAVIYNIQNNYEGSNNQGANHVSHHNCTFNPIEKWLEVIEENKKLYERLLQSEKDKVEILRGSRS